MTATGHAIIGTVIAAKIGNPALAIPIALASHIAADMIPHWDPATNGKKKGDKRLFADSAVDVILSFLVAYFLAFYFFPEVNIAYLFFIVICSQALDWTTMPYYFFDINLPPFTWAYKFQKLFDNKLDKPWGIITQIVTVIVVLMIGLLI